MASPGTQGLASWRFKDEHVQPAIDQKKFISFESTVMCFGPSQLSALAAASTPGTIPNTDSRTIAVYPAGLIESFQVGQGQSVAKLYEIGSVRSYLFAGRPDGNASFSRILYHGPSALRSAYAAFRDRRGLFNSLVGNTAPGVTVIDGGNNAPGTVNANNQPDHDFFFNLQSILFRNPFGAMIYMKDTEGTPFAGMYYETCMVTTHGFGISAGMVSIMEQVSMNFERIVPVNVRFVG